MIPEIKTPANGSKMLRMSIATDASYKDAKCKSAGHPFEYPHGTEQNRQTRRKAFHQRKIDRRGWRAGKPPMGRRRRHQTLRHRSAAGELLIAREEGRLDLNSQL